MKSRSDREIDRQVAIQSAIRRSEKESGNRLLKVVALGEKILFEVGASGDSSVWPIVLNINGLDRHVFLSRRVALDLADALIEATDRIEVRCEKCPEVENAKIHDRASHHWMHDYQERAV